MEEKIEEADLCEDVICNISDEEDNVSQVMISEPTKSSLPILVADYKDETDDGKYLINKLIHMRARVSAYNIHLYIYRIFKKF